jgi:hypothetical protein
MNNHSLQSVSISTFLVPTLLAVILLGIIFLPSSDASGQSIDEGWSPPINLSQSGGASSPIMVVDEAGTAHVFWLDEYAGYFYRSGDGETWGSRTRVDPPFDPYSPSLVLGSNNRVHTFWIDEDNDLYWSRASVDELSNSSAWETPLLLASFVVDFSVEVDAQNGIHVSYIYNEDEDGLAAGAGYLSSSNNGSSWSEPASLFQSPYIRGLASANANIDMASTELGEGLWVYAGWDNPVRKQISLARSLNGGSTWEDPLMIDGPEFGSSSVIPYNLRIAASDEKALLVWLKGQPGARCTIHYKWSEDGGNSWSDRLRMLEEALGCPSDLDFIPVGSDFFLLQVTFPDLVYLLAWDGSQWSEPQLQRSIIEFEDPETYNLLDFSCRQYGTGGPEDKLYLVGCDLTGANDIWLTSRGIGDTTVWYPLPGIWSKPIRLAAVTEEIMDPLIIAGPESLLHAFWASTGEGPAAAKGVSSIYYARLFEGAWSRPAVVLNSLEGSARFPDVALDQSGRLFTIWSGGDSGVVQMSWAGANQAYRPSDWTLPRQLPAPVAAGSSPDMHAFGTDRLFVVYAVPLNEDRGVYFVSSEDAGNTWSEPNQVVNAVNFGWDMVNQPKLTVSLDGTIHVLFTRFSLPGGRGPLSLHYTRSVDGGITWVEPSTVAEQFIYWSRIVTGNDNLIHRIWQGIDSASNRPVVYHQYSRDNGSSWSSTDVISPLQLLGPVDLVVDSVGRLHLVMSVTHSTGEVGLEHWIWSGDRWSVDQGMKLDDGEVISIDALSASISPSDRLAVLYSVASLPDLQYSLVDTGTNPGRTNFVAYTGRDLDLLAAIMAPLPELPLPPTGTTEPELLITPVLTPTMDLPAPTAEEPQDAAGASADNTWTGLVLGAGLAVVLVAVAFGINAKKMGRR